MLGRTGSWRNGFAAIVSVALLASCSGDRPSDEVTVSLVAVQAPGGGAPPKVNATDPTGSPPAITLDVRVIGSGYDDQSSVEFLLAGSSVQDVVVNSATFVSSSELLANVTVGTTAVEAFYDVGVTNGRGKKGVGIELFEVASLSLNGRGAPVVTEFRDGADRIRSDFDGGSGSRSYATISKHQAIGSEVTPDGRQWLQVNARSSREVCVDFPAVGPDAQILSPADWDALVTDSGGEVGLGQRWCGIVTMHTRNHSDLSKLFEMDTDPTTAVDDVQASGGKLIMKEYDTPKASWQWRLMFDDNHSAVNGGDNSNGLCIRLDPDGSFTLGTDPTIEDEGQNPVGNVCSDIDEYVNLIRLTSDPGFVHVARFRMPFRLTLRPD